MRVHRIVRSRNGTRAIVLAGLVLVATVVALAFPQRVGTAAIAVQSNRITKQQVVVAAATLPAGHTLTASDVRIELRAIDAIPPHSAFAVDEVIGKRLAAELAPGASLLLANLKEVPPPPAPPVVAAHDPVPVKAAAPEPVPAAKVAAVEEREQVQVKRTTVVLPSVEQRPKVAPLTPGEPYGDSPAPPVQAADRSSEPAPAAVETAHREEGAKVAAAPQDAPSAAAPAPAKADVRAQLEEPGASAPRRGYSSYVWVTGGKYSYGIDDDGSLKSVDRLGNTAVVPRKKSTAPVQRAH